MHNDKLVRKEELEKYRREEKIIEETTRQVIKDFAMFGMDIHFSGQVAMAYEELFRQLDEQISRLLRWNETKLKALLYQIDLRESDLQRYPPSDPSFSLSRHITELVLHRELKKVLTRIYFRENPGKL